jgi:hypothetical protein
MSMTMQIHASMYNLTCDTITCSLANGLCRHVKSCTLVYEMGKLAPVPSQPPRPPQLALLSFNAVGTFMFNTNTSE